MFKLFNSAIFFSAFLTAVQPATYQDCNTSTILSCAAAFDQTMQNFKLDSIILNDPIPAWNQTMLEPLCISYYLYSQCMETVIPHCDQLYQLAAEGVENAWQNMCDNSSDEFHNYSSCFGQLDVRKAANVCNDTLTLRIQAFFQRQKKSSSDYCSYHDDYVSCLSDVVEPACGLEANTWSNSYVKLLLQPTMSAVHCPGWDDSSDTSGWSESSIVISIFIGITLFLMVVIVIVLIIMVLNRRRQQQMRSASSAVGLDRRNSNDPPSYCEPYIVYEPTSSDVTSDTNSTIDGTFQFRLQYVDPLTGLRRDGGVVDETDLPYKINPSLPPPYAERPPPSFDETFPAAETSTPPDMSDIITTVNITESQPAFETTGENAGAVNAAFSPDEGDAVLQEETNESSDKSPQKVETSDIVTHL